MSEPERWWASEFPDSVITGHGLPKPEVMSVFWEKYFPPFSIISQYFTNADQYWKRLQRIMVQMHPSLISTNLVNITSAKITNTSNSIRTSQKSSYTSPTSNSSYTSNSSKTIVDNNFDVPCPFQKVKLFVPVFYDFVKSLNYRSVPQLISFLEVAPKSYEAQSMLWSIPTSIGDPSVLLLLLDELYSSKHWIWKAMMNIEGTDDLIFDRLAPYIMPLSSKSSYHVLYLRLLALDIVAAVFVHHPRFPDPFESLFAKYLAVLKTECDLQIQCFRSLCYIFDSIRSANVIGIENLINYVKDFAEAVVTVKKLKGMIGPYIISLKIQRLSVFYVAKLYLQNEFDHNDLSFIINNGGNGEINCNSNSNSNNNNYSNNFKSNSTNINNNSSNFIFEKPTSVIQQLLIISVSDYINSKTCLKAICALKKWFDLKIPAVCAFVQRTVGFVIIARTNGAKCRHVSMVFDLLRCLSTLGHEWLKNEVSKGAAVLLASQKVPLAIVNPLKPAMHCDKAELLKWERMSTSNSFDFMSLVLENNIKSDEKSQQFSNNQCEKQHENAPKPPQDGQRSAPMRSSLQRSNLPPYSKTKTREVMRPQVKNPTGKYFKNYRSNQS